jgi:hypothetical protein
MPFAEQAGALLARHGSAGSCCLLVFVPVVSFEFDVAVVAALSITALITHGIAELSEQRCHVCVGCLLFIEASGSGAHALRGAGIHRGSYM